MFKMIRCGTGFDPVIMVSPADAKPDTPEAKFYRCASWQIHDHQPDVLNEISRNIALSYFSGIADGIGFEIPPSDIFPTLEEALLFVIAKRNEAEKIFAEKHPEFSLQEEGEENGITSSRKSVEQMAEHATEYFEPMTFGELSDGQKFIFLPEPGDNHGHGGLRGGGQFIFKKLCQNVECSDGLPPQHYGIPHGRALNIELNSLSDFPHSMYVIAVS